MDLLKKYKEIFLSGLLLVSALSVDHLSSLNSAHSIAIALYGISYVVIGGPIWIKAVKSIRNGVIFGEFLLMGIATVGAFFLGQYAEGVAVMLFYTIGEEVQHGAVNRARHSIKKLINEQPDIATVERNDTMQELHPSKVEQGEIIRVKPGQKVPLDGELLTGNASFNTAALTGESKPMTVKKGNPVWAGAINLDQPVRIKVTKTYKDTRLSKILDLVQEAAHRKAPTQRFMTKFARVYTPTVVWLAVGLTFIPWLFVEHYEFADWLYRALIFLVVSCPCGLVISIPLGYFGGIGAASRHGILFKGSDYLDRIRNLNALYFDKTGTMTEGSFKVRNIQSHNGLDSATLITLAASVEQHSTHPVAQAIMDYSDESRLEKAENVEEISGKGMVGSVEGKQVLVGNRELLETYGISNGYAEGDSPYTDVYIAVDGDVAGMVSIADQVKEDSRSTVQALKRAGVEELIMLSGDQQKVVDYVADELGLDRAIGELLPDEKYKEVEQALGDNKTVGFVGDGVNDAPVITLADIGFAMGGIGSDATIETADVVIQTDQPSKISTALNIANFTHRIVWENIIFAIGIKVLVLGLATLGMATMWEAIFADVGVALIAILNAVRIQQKPFD